MSGTAVTSLAGVVFPAIVRCPYVMASYALRAALPFPAGPAGRRASLRRFWPSRVENRPGCPGLAVPHRRFHLWRGRFPALRPTVWADWPDATTGALSRSTRPRSANV